MKLRWCWEARLSHPVLFWCWKTKIRHVLSRNYLKNLMIGGCIQLVGVGPRCTIVANFYVDFTSCYLLLRWYSSTTAISAIVFFSSDPYHTSASVCPAKIFMARWGIWSLLIPLSSRDTCYHIHSTFTTLKLYEQLPTKSMLWRWFHFRKLKQKQQGFLSYISFYSQKTRFFLAHWMLSLVFALINEL